MRRGVLLVAVLAGCGPLWDGVGGSSDEIADAVAASKPFRLADVTDFEWDRFYSFGSYLTQARVDRQLGFHWGDAQHSDYADSDGGSLLVFVRDGEVVEAFDQSNADGIFDCVGDDGLTPEEALLRVKRVHEADETFDYVLAPRRARGCSL